MGAEANTFREKKKSFSVRRGDQYIIFRDQGSTDPPGGLGYVRSNRHGDRIVQYSILFIIFCYSFDNKFILSFLGNHYSLTFQFCSLFSYHC